MDEKIDELWDPWTGDELARATESVHETYVALQQPKNSEVKPEGD